MRNAIAGLTLLACLGGPAVAAGEMVQGILIAQDLSEQIADFRLDRPPALARVEQPLLDFTKAEGVQFTSQVESGQTSFTLVINPATTIFVIQPIPRGPLFFTLLMQPGHAAEKPAQLALFERLKGKLRAESRVEGRIRSPGRAAPGPRSLDLGFDGGFIDDGPDGRDPLVAEFVKDILGEFHPAAVDRQAKEQPLGAAVETQARRDMGRIAHQQINAEPQVRDLLEILLQHLAIARQAKGTAVMLGILGDKLAKVGPIPGIETGDIGAIDRGETAVGHGAAPMRGGSEIRPRRAKGSKA